MLCSTDARDLRWMEGNVPCQHACPAATNIPDYTRKGFQGDYGASYEVNRLCNVFPGVLGRICARPCEKDCRHGEAGLGEPVAICWLKRAAADMRPQGHRIVEELYNPSGKSVAVVGAGPAGLAAAHELAAFGHHVIVYDEQEEPGGMLRYGIPGFRLPRELIALETGNILRLGVELRAGVRVGRDVRVSELLAAHDAVILATGCYRERTLGFAGEDELKGVYSGLDFMMRVNRGEEPAVGERVMVIGDGFTAIDCCRMALRLGAREVSMNVLTTEEYFIMDADEVFETKHEGVRVNSLVTSAGFVAEGGRVAGMHFQRNRLGGFNAHGRRQSHPIEGSTRLSTP